MTRRPQPIPHPRRLWIVLGVALLAVSCGSPDREITVGQGPGEAPLPTLPSIAERNPGQFVDGGCAATSNGPDCSATAAEIDAAQSGVAGGEWRTLAGFVGPDWSTQTTGTIAVLESTVTASTSGAWTATGLVRNETASTVGDVVVEATLLDTVGATLGVVTGPLAIPSLRAGEPGPFALAAPDGIDAATVASVAWSVQSRPVPSEPARDLELVVFWQRALGDPRPADMYLHADPSSGPLPLVVFGIATAVGSAPIPGTVVTGAWIDEAGRVLALADATMGVDAAPAAQADVSADGSADFVLVVDAAEAPAGLDAANLMLWGTGS